MTIKLNFVIILVAIGWIVNIIQGSIGPLANLSQFGIIPGEPIGLLGILPAPFIHVNRLYLILNTIPLFFLGFTLSTLYPRSTILITFGTIILSGLLLWIFGEAKDTAYNGGSALIFAFAGFLLFSGFYRIHLVSIIVPVIVGIGYITITSLTMEEILKTESSNYIFGFIAGSVFSIFTLYKKISSTAEEPDY